MNYFTFKLSLIFFLITMLFGSCSFFLLEMIADFEETEDVVSDDVSEENEEDDVFDEEIENEEESGENDEQEAVEDNENIENDDSAEEETTDEITDPDLSSYYLVRINTEQFLITWDDQAAATSRFRLYYREFGEDDLTFIVETDASAGTELLCNAADFPRNRYLVIAISAVDLDEQESDFHYSTDQDAYPDGGWVLIVD